MGEAKRKRESMTPAERAALDATHKLVNDGKLIAGGFAAYCMAMEISVDDPMLPRLQHAYMTAAEHLWQSVMSVMDPGPKETAADLKRFDLIHAEITAWRTQLEGELAMRMKTKGSA